MSFAVASGELSGVLRVDDIALPLRDVRGVWYRRPNDVALHPDLDETYQQFALAEAREALRDFYCVLYDRRWVSPPFNIWASDHKMYQMRVAHSLGFKTSPAIVTNDPYEVEQFFHKCQRGMIYKTMRQKALEYTDGVGYGVYASLIDKESLEEQLDSIPYIPCLFQEFIPKKYELRINVIGSYVWATAIYSQDVEDVKLDLRENMLECRHEPILLPPKLEQCCREIVRLLGLRMGNIDIIVTPDDEYYFLEVNPNGQWAWIEDLVGFPLATALVDELIGEDTLANHPYIKDRSLIFEPNTAIKEFA